MTLLLSTSRSEGNGRVPPLRAKATGDAWSGRVSPRLSEIDGDRTQLLEHEVVGNPPVEYRVRIVTEPHVAGWRQIVDEVRVASSADDDARVPMPCEHHAQSSRIEM